MKVKVNVMLCVIYFFKLEKFDISFFMYGWGGSIIDVEIILMLFYCSCGDKGVGEYNYGNFCNDKVDVLVV